MAEAEALDFAGLGSGKLRHEFDFAWGFERGDASGYECFEFSAFRIVGGAVVAQYDERLYDICDTIMSSVRATNQKYPSSSMR